MIARLKKVLYTVEGSNDDVVVQAVNDGSVQAWAIAPFRAACVTAKGKHPLKDLAWAVPANVLRSAKSPEEALERQKISALPLGDWRVEVLRSLDEADKVSAAIVRVSDLMHVRELYAKSLPAYYCELSFGEERIKFEGRAGKVIIPAKVMLPGRIGVNVRYLTEAIENLLAKDDISISAVQLRKDTNVLVLSSEHERHYIAEATR